MLTLLLTLGTAAADTLDVCPSGCTYQTIQPAVDAAVAGDIVEVGTGTYGAFTILDRADITIRAATGAQAVLSGLIPESAAFGNVVEIRRSRDITVSGFDAVGGSRRVGVIVDSVVTWSDMTARDATLAFNGAGVLVSNSTVVIRDSVFDNNRGTDVARGGHLFASTGSDLTIIDTDFTGGSATDGGALWLSGSVATVDGGTWSNNSAFEGDGAGAGAGSGGAILVTQNATLAVENAAFIDNTAEADGGHIVAFSATVALTSVDMDDGEAVRGGLIFGTASDITLDDCALTNGSALDEGGLIFSTFSTFSAAGGAWSGGTAQVGGNLFLQTAIVNLDGVDLSDGSALSEGGRDAPSGDGRGGLIASRSSSLTVAGGDWSGGVASDDAGGVWVDSGPATFDGTSFSNNEADDNGGALWLSGTSPVLITGALFAGNLADDGAGIQHNSSAQLVVQDSGFVGNTSRNRGAGIDASRSRTVQLTDVAFWDNEADSGAGLSMRRETSLAAVRTQYCGNVAANQGGGIRLDSDDTSARIVNSTWADNMANTGGGLWINSDGGEANLDQVTFRANDANTGSALYVANAAVGLSNAIVADQVIGAAVHTASGGQVRVGYTNWWNNSGGNTGGQLSDANLGGTNLFVDPEFQGPLNNEDCERSVWVAYTSPTIDAADADGSGSDPADTIPSAQQPADLGALGGALASASAWLDADGDGWPVMWDCDDQAATTYPGADELCNGMDDDCDGEFDEDAVDLTTTYADVDGDGFGNPETEEQSCGDVPTGRVEDGTDCDDDDSGVFPGAEEVCDGMDQDCDGIDDNDAIDAVRTFLDSDEDGFGNDAIIELVCGEPSPGYVLIPGDCDDALHTVYPLAPELCDGISNDCDEDIDEDPVDGREYLVDGDGDGFGSDVVVVACEEPSNAVNAGGDCDDGNPDIRPSADEVCNSVDDNCDGVTDPPGSIGSLEVYPDFDGDTFGAIVDAELLCEVGDNQTTTPGDCDDSESTVNPDAEEVCDGLDNNCNDEIDEDVTGLALWYIDTDLDGYGDPNAPSVESCQRPEGYVLNDDDCDDSNSEVLPIGEERCNGLDNDCDGFIDNEPVDGIVVFPDTDGDGQGDANAQGERLCEVVGGVTNQTDCDDSERTVFLGATEICDDLDNDCDGEVDEDVRFVQWYVDQDQDGVGGDSVGDPDCAPPEDGAVQVDGDCDDTDPTVFPGADEVVGDGIDQDCDGLDTLEEPVSGRDFIPSDEQPEVLPTGCDCQSGQAPSSVAWLTLLTGGLLVVRRRRAC